MEGRFLSLPRRAPLKTSCSTQVVNPFDRRALGLVLFMGIQSSPRRAATQYQDPMWPRRHTHRSLMFVEIFGHLVAFATARVKPGNHSRKFGLDSGEVDGMMGWLLARKE
jgi:hypothetical protein